MKTLKINIVALMLMMGVMSTIALAQNVTVPQNVRTAFSQKFPGVKLKNWKLEYGQYVASFVMDKRDCEATYDHEGNWISSMTIYRHLFKHLTPQMRDELRNSRYASYHLDQVKSLQMPNMDMLLLTIDNDNGNMSAYENAGSVDMETVYFNHSGRIIKSVNNQ
ncbi:MAG: hypothetical protein JST50_18010 [Bacteroidetes bacterium]|jgi:hypothetical protein|nr:hypothetical protein [Bacteroidota bacterium]